MSRPEWALLGTCTIRPRVELARWAMGELRAIRAPMLWGKATTMPDLRPLPLTSRRPRTETWCGLVEQWTEGTQLMLAIVSLLAGVVVWVGTFGAVAPGAVMPGAAAPPAPLVAETDEEALAGLSAPTPKSTRQSANSAAPRVFECSQFDCLQTAVPTTTTHS